MLFLNQKLKDTLSKNEDQAAKEVKIRLQVKLPSSSNGEC